MTLRTRLVLALMVLALVPTAVFTAFTLDQLGRSTERWFRPGVDRALESGVEVSKTALTRMETTVLALADECAARSRTRPADPTRRRIARDLLEGSGVDLVQFYTHDGERWQLTAQAVPEGILLPEPLDFSAVIDSTLGSTRIVRSDSGALAALASVDEQTTVAAAMWVPESFFADMDSVGFALGYYRQLAVVVDVQRQFVWLLVALLSVALVALAFLLANVLGGQMSRPLGELSSAIQRVAHGELEVRVKPEGARELRALGDAFNAMTARLAGQRDQLKEAEREAAWREVARRLAHEFKNILTPMALSLHRLNRRAEAVEASQRTAVRESLDSLSRGVEQMTRLSEQFSQYARLPEPRHDRLDLTRVTEEAAKLHEHEGIEVRLEPGPPLQVRGDSLLLSRAIHNLLLNACEASPPGTVVVIVTRQMEDEGAVEVLDRGPGLSADVQGRAFEPYVSTKKRGSGLGLSLVRDIATQHGGRVSIENRQGGGACARLVLPLVPEQEAPRT